MRNQFQSPFDPADHADQDPPLWQQSNLSKTISIAVKWTRALQGEPDLPPVLSDFAALLGAGSVRLLRYESDRSAWRLACSAVPGSAMYTPLKKSHAARILENSLESAAVGSVWLYSDLLAESDPAQLAHLSERLQADTLSDVAVLVLQRQGPYLDMLEFQFDHVVPRYNADLLISLSPEISENWQKRRTGTFDRIVAQYSWGRAKPAQCKTQQDILGPQNPCALSRLEFRVCLLLSQGLLPKQIAAQLEIKLCTVRSHLTSIYGKTETSGQLELMHQLYSGKMRGDDAIRPSSRLGRTASDTL